MLCTMVPRPMDLFLGTQKFENFSYTNSTVLNIYEFPKVELNNGTMDVDFQNMSDLHQ